jgi:hypothetical protein
VNDDPSAQPNLDLTDPGLDDPDLTDPDIDRPTDRPDLDHLRPDRIRIGSVGVFAGDWAWTPDAAGAMRIPVGFVGTLIDTWNGWAVFTCTRQVAEAIVADQQLQRDQYRQALTDQGVPDGELQTRVDQSMSKLTFDGDTIVADQRGLYDDPEAIECIEPDAQGLYVVMGWNWCWEAVDPADCDRIVGDLPAPGQQQQFAQLTHTPGMRLPHDRLRVRVLGQWAGATGLAFTAAVTLDGVPVATIHDHGDGTGIQLDADGSGWAGMAEYLAGCRLYGAPVDQRRLLVALVDEHYLSGATAQAHAEGATLVRLVDDAGNTRALRPVEPPRGWPARQELARALARESAGLGWPGCWQLWGGTGWTHLVAVGEQPDPPAPGSGEQD